MTTTRLSSSQKAQPEGDHVQLWICLLRTAQPGRRHCQHAPVELGAKQRVCELRQQCAELSELCSQRPSCRADQPNDRPNVPSLPNRGVLLCEDRREHRRHQQGQHHLPPSLQHLLPVLLPHPLVLVHPPHRPHQHRARLQACSTLAPCFWKNETQRYV